MLFSEVGKTKDITVANHNRREQHIEPITTQTNTIQLYQTKENFDSEGAHKNAEISVRNQVDHKTSEILGVSIVRNAKS